MIGIREFNTGRPYTEQGQLIRFKVENEKHTVFFDKVRMITGVISGLDNPTPEKVLKAYDNNEYFETVSRPDLVNFPWG